MLVTTVLGNFFESQCCVPVTTVMGNFFESQCCVLVTTVIGNFFESQCCVPVTTVMGNYRSIDGCYIFSPFPRIQCNKDVETLIIHILIYLQLHV